MDSGNDFFHDQQFPIGQPVQHFHNIPFDLFALLYKLNHANPFPTRELDTHRACML